MAVMPGNQSPDDKEAASIGALRRDAEKLRKSVHRRSVVGLGVTWAVVAAFSLIFFLFPNVWQRIGSALTVVGTAYMCIQLRMRPARVMPDMDETESLRFYRDELERQRDFHQGRWFWSRLAILLPGPLIFFVGFARAYPRLATFGWMELAAFIIFCACAVPLNLGLARKYQRRIDVLRGGM
jgi:hypothetical protein